MSGLLFNGRFLTRRATGVDRFAIELTAALARREDAVAPKLAVPANAQVREESRPQGCELVSVGGRGGQRWEQWDLPRSASDQILVNLCNAAPLLRKRQLVVIHDLGTVANAGNYSTAFRAWYRLMHSAVMQRSDVIATVSRFSANELLLHYKRGSRGVEVIGEGGEHILRHVAEAGILSRLHLAGRRYVLAVGTQSPNKNFRAVVAAMRLLRDPDMLLVAVGGGDTRVFASGGHEAESDQEVKVIFTGYVSNGELRALYENAACFAFPSFYEGFGLPPLEAMCCGCPVIVSDRASLPEVCGDAALYCQPDDPTSLAIAFRRIFASRALANELRTAGLERARLFSWDKAALQLQQVLDAKFS